jgi:hypothetical protein
LFRVLPGFEAFSGLEDWEDSMLPPFIIEQIRRREEEERKQYEQPQLELPVSPVSPSPPREPKRREESDEGQRGVIILEL